MADRRIVEYLNLGKKKGIPLSSLKKLLMEKGHSAAAVDEAAKEANFGNSSHSYIIILIGLVLVLTLVVVMNLGNMAETQPKNMQNENIGKKTETIPKQLTQEEQLAMINKALSSKYSGYQIKNYREAWYNNGKVLRAEVDLGTIDVCSQKIKADNAIIVVDDGKIIPTPVSEIKNRFLSMGAVIYDTTDSKSTNPDIHMVDRQISYDCTNNVCSNCQLNNVYEVLIKLNSTYTKNVDSLLGFRSGIIRTPSANPGSSPPIMKLPGSPPLNGSTGPNGQKLFRVQPGEISITHKLFLVDSIGNVIYTSEGSEKENNMIFLKGEFS